MYRIKCWNFKKKLNSTAVPEADTGVEFVISLKRGCSILNPVFLLDSSSFDYNYVYFNGRYYWVNDVTWERDNIVSVQCSVDVLGSWRNEIKSTKAYVNYSQSDFNVYLQDTRIPMETNGTTLSETVSLPEFNTTGCYVLGTIGSTQVRTAGGFINLHALDSNALNDLSVFFSTEEDLITQITGQFGNAFGCIVSLKWIPYTLPAGVAPIYLGSHSTGVVGYPITERNIHGQLYLNIPFPYNDFRRYEPYCSAVLSLPFVGVIPLQMSDLVGLTTLTISYSADLFTGDIVYSLINSQGKLAVYTGNFASDIPVSTYQYNIKGAATSILSGGINTGGAMAADSQYGLAAGVASGVASIGSSFINAALNYLSPIVGTQGGFSGNCGVYLGTDVTLIIRSHNTSQSPSSMAEVAGRPCGKTLTIGDLSGYCECATFKIMGNMTENEKREIIGMMKGGVFIE